MSSLINAATGTVIITSDEHRAMKRVKKLIESVSAYRNTCSDASACSTLADVLAHTRNQTKSELIELGEGAYAMDADGIALFSETSGTTKSGPLLTPRGRDELRWNSFNQARAYLPHIRPGADRLAILHPTIMSPFAEATAMALQQLGVGYLRIFPIERLCDYERIARIFENYGITSVMTTPTLAYKLLYEFHVRGYQSSHLDKLLLTGELITESCVRNFAKLAPSTKSNFARPFVYGSSESATCMYGELDGTYRGFTDDFLFEVIPDPLLNSNSDPLSVTGELVISWLQPGIMPLLRYRTGDVFTVRKEGGGWAFKPCGRSIAIGSRAVNPYAVDAFVFSLPYAVFHFDIDVRSGEAFMTLIVKGDEAAAAKDDKTISTRITEILGLPTSICVNPRVHSFYDFSPLPKTVRILQKQ